MPILACFLRAVGADCPGETPPWEDCLVGRFVFISNLVFFKSDVSLRITSSIALAADCEAFSAHPLKPPTALNTISKALWALLLESLIMAVNVAHIRSQDGKLTPFYTSYLHIDSAVLMLFKTLTTFHEVNEFLLLLRILSPLIFSRGYTICTCVDVWVVPQVGNDWRASTACSKNTRLVLLWQKKLLLNFSPISPGLNGDSSLHNDWWFRPNKKL